MMRIFISAATYLFFSSQVLAAGIEVTGISGVSNYRLPTASTTGAIWGGVAGPLTGSCAAPSTTSTCSNCVTAETACNDFRIHDSLIFRITFKVTADTTGPLKVGIGTVSTFDELPSAAYSPSQTSYTKGSTGTVDISWASLCGEITGGASTCETLSTSGDLILYVGTGSATDANSVSLDVVVHEPQHGGGGYDTLECGTAVSPSSGICYFHAYPGDKKIYYGRSEAIDSFGTYPTNNSVRYIKIRVFFSTISFTDADYPTGSYADLDIPDGSDAPDPDLVEGLENDVTYYVRSAMIDEAYNQAFLIDRTTIDADSGGACNANNDPGNPADDPNCNMMATPSAVYGLLPEDLNCFILTATYGSNMASGVKVFRTFRDRFLIPSKWGRAIILQYYNYGAKASQYIAKNESLRKLSRVLLTPPLWFAKLSLMIGLWQAALYIVFTFVGLILAALVHHKNRRLKLCFA